MFKPTLSRQKRVERRFQGFRVKSIRIIRQALAAVQDSHTGHAYALIPSKEQQSHLYSDSCDSNQQDVGCTSRKASRRWSPTVRMALFRESITHSTVGDGMSKLFPTKMGNCRYRQILTPNWRHSVYRYNKTAACTLPVLGSNVSYALQTFFNMEPREAKPQISSSEFSYPVGLTVHRAFLSDQRTDKRYIQPHLLGKLSNRRNAFWRPYRQLIKQLPRIQFNHYQSTVSVRLFVYDRRLDLARQRLQILESTFRRAIINNSRQDRPTLSWKL